MEEKVISVNRKAYHDYTIGETYEAGLVLTGTEIKSIRAGRVNLRDSFVRIENGEAWVYGMHISPYEQGNRYNVEPTRRRKLLLRREQIEKLGLETKAKGYTIIPTRLYIKNDVAKLAIALAKGKQQFDKRSSIAKREAQRDVERALRERVKAGSRG